MSEQAPLPPHLRPLAALLAGQPLPIRQAYEYYLCMLLVQREQMRLVETWRDGSNDLCRFAAADGACYVVPRMVVSRETEAAIMRRLSDLLGE